MIEFYGELSEQCKKYIINREKKVGTFAALIVSVIFSIPIIILSIIIDWIFLLAFFVLILIILLSWLQPTSKIYGKILPKRVSIKNGIIESEGDDFDYVEKLSSVKFVLDMGEWYHIYFKYKYRNFRFICQKDLIKQGTLEEFEDLFVGKIIKK